MVQKAHLLFNLITAISIFIASCSTKDKEMDSLSLVVNIDMIPKDTVLSNDKNLKLVNGVYYLNKKAFSGYIKELSNQKIVGIGSYWNGKQEGITQTFFKNGKLRDSRSYKNGKSYGRHLGYWENGKMKFDFTYINDKREGENKQWYESGAPYAFLSFKNDQENGIQRAWRENGKPYINYEAKDGFRYGLQKSALCYTLRDGKIKMK
jgi:antitoxin component YwqK of YwqJK toxin-antitoxin module